MLYTTWVGFWECEDIKPMPWKELWSPASDLVRVPNDTWDDSSWPGCTFDTRYFRLEILSTAYL